VRAAGLEAGRVLASALTSRAVASALASFVGLAAPFRPASTGGSIGWEASPFACTRAWCHAPQRSGRLSLWALIARDRSLLHRDLHRRRLNRRFQTGLCGHRYSGNKYASRSTMLNA
jgi:hypothetical protein